MAGPYLKSGESIILTTDRVLIDDIEYDVILTSQRLTLVDSGHTSDQPQAIPFATILSVKGGTTPAREPFITLMVIDPIGLEDSRTIDLIFSQQPYEDRAGECDIWVQKLIENIVSVRQEPAPATGKQQVPVKSRGMDPTVRRFVAPDVPLPHSQVAHETRRPTEKLLSDIQETAWETQDEACVESDDQQSPEPDINPTPEYESVQQEHNHAFDEEVLDSSPTPQEPVDLADSDSPLESDSARDTGIIIPVERPIKTARKPDQVTAPVTPFGERMSGSMDIKPESSGPTRPEESPGEEEMRLTADGTEPEKDVESHVRIPSEFLLNPNITPEPGIPGRPDQEKKAGTPIEKPAEPRCDNETSGLDLTGEAVARIEAEPDHEDAPAGSQPEPAIQTGLPDTVVFPVLSGVSHPDTPETPPAKIPPAVLTPADKPRVSQPVKIPVRAIAAIILVILAILGGAAVMLLHPTGNPTEPDHPVITLTPTILPITTTAPIVVPADGVWVKVTYNGTFVGKYGNPGGLKEVRGTGEQLYAIKNNNDLVQVSFTKQDDYGDFLTVEVYNNGTMVTQVAKRTPGGTIFILVDPKTGKAPYVPVTTLNT
jgi:hypothetical protein